MDFTNCKWHKKGGRDTLYDEVALFNEKNPAKDKIKKVEILYRQLKQKYKAEHNEFEVSNWHYGEKEMQRKGSLWSRYFPLSFLNLYWASSGYGERPLRAGVVLLALIAILTIGFGLLGIEQPLTETIIAIQSWQDINWDNFKYLLLSTFQYSLFDKNPDFIPATITGKFLKVFTQILIPLQTALFALAVRNRFRR